MKFVDAENGRKPVRSNVFGRISHKPKIHNIKSNHGSEPPA